MEHELYPVLPMGNVSGSLTLSDEDQVMIHFKLWAFLGKHTERYTAGDSSSVPIETSQELLTSICFVLDAYFRLTGSNPKLLATENLDILFQAGLKAIEAKIGEGKQLWNAACISAPDIENISYMDTLRSIGDFFKYYDYRFLAHQIPCDIDYQLCRPVPERLQGIEYINEYLRRITIENGILHLFERDLIVRLLEQFCADYKGLLINLCEPVIVNAVGLALIQETPLALQISASARFAIVRKFEPLTESDARAALVEAANRFCYIGGIKDEYAREYILSAATDLYPRIHAALPTGSLSGIFLTF